VVILGVGLVPICPVSMGFASELTFPIAPATTNGILLMIGHLMGTIVALVGTPLCAINPEALILFYVAMTLVTFVCSFFVKEKLKKLEYIKAQKLLEDQKEQERLQENY
jgi:hypothetical protein